jgi:putative phosphoesterase
MKWGIVSDSHGAVDRLAIVFDTFQKNNIFNVIHAGDFLNEGAIEVLKLFPDLKFYIARGNCDVNEALWDQLSLLGNVEAREVLRLESDGKKIGVAHILADAIIAFRGEKLDIVIYGHTHREVTEERDNRIYINPGSLQDTGRYFILDTEVMRLEKKFYDTV